MKLRYLFSSILASALLFVGCVEESFDSFDDIKLEKTYLTIPEEGGDVTLKFTTTVDWAFAKSDIWPNVITYVQDKTTGKDKLDENGNKVIETSEPSWLTLKEGPMEGKAGEYSLVFTAQPVDGGREIEIQINAGQNAQYFRVRQGSMLASEATVKEVMEGPDGKSYRVQGVCTSITGTYYGNWYLQDGTYPETDLYIYGTKDADGQYNWESFDIEVGDSVMVEGPKTTYNGKTVELVDVSVVKVIKSLIKLVEPTDKLVNEQGEVFEVKLAYKGSGVFYAVADECKEWLRVDGMTYKSGTPTKIEPNPADTAFVKVIVDPYGEPSSRVGKIEFSSSNSKSTSKITFSLRQGVEELSVADFLAKEVGSTPYKLTGRIANLANTTYGNFDLVDATGSIYVYGLTATKVTENDKTFSTLNLREGDVVTLIGTRAEYKEVAQVGGPAYYVEHVGSTDVTVEEFLASPVADEPYYRLTGEITEIANAEYGNIYIKDATGSVYVYGLTVAPVAKNDKSFAKLELKVGDVVTLVGTHAEYKGTAQVGVAYYVSHVPAPEEGGDDEGEVVPASAITIPELNEKAAAAGTTKTYLSEETNYELTAVVCGNSQNSSYGTVYVMTKGSTAAGNGFVLYDSSLDGKYNVGDEIKVTLKAGVAQVTQYKGNSQLTGVKDTDVTKVSEGNAVTPVTVVPADLPKYLGMPVTVENATVATDGVWCTEQNHGSHTFSASGTEFTVYVNKRATVFHDVEYVAATGNISGIAVTYEGSLQLAPRDMEDVKAFAKTSAVEPADPWETAAKFVNDGTSYGAYMKELRVYADEENMYVRLTVDKAHPGNYVDMVLADGEAGEKVWWGWTTTHTKKYHLEHKGDITDGNLTKMRWYHAPETEGDRVYVDFTTEVVGDDYVWSFVYPREWIGKYASSTGKIYVSFILWDNWDRYWAIPQTDNAMLEVTLP